VMQFCPPCCGEEERRGFVSICVGKNGSYPTHNIIHKSTALKGHAWAPLYGRPTY